MSDFLASGVVAALSPYMSSAPAVQGASAAAYKLPDWAKDGPAQSFAHLPAESLAAGLEPDLDEVRSAVLAIPPAAIATEDEWVRLARALAHEAAVFPNLRESLWDILDEASGRAPSYDQEENRRRFDRYTAGALARDTPITLATAFYMASVHGWQGWSLPVVPTASASSWSPADLRVSLSQVPHRRWLYGTYLIRGEVTVMAAPGGVGKTALATGVAVDVATGVELLGEKIYKQRDLTVLFINGEDGGSEIERRVWAFCLAHANKLSGCNLDRLLIAGANDGRVQRLLCRNIAVKTGHDPKGVMINVVKTTMDILKRNEGVVHEIANALDRDGVIRRAALAQIFGRVDRIS